MLTRKQKLTLIFISALISVALYTVYFATADGRWIFPQFPGFMAAFTMCGQNCAKADAAVSNLTWVMISFIQYYAILRLFAAVYLRFKKR